MIVECIVKNFLASQANNILWILNASLGLLVLSLVDFVEHPKQITE